MGDKIYETGKQVDESTASSTITPEEYQERHQRLLLEDALTKLFGVQVTPVKIEHADGRISYGFAGKMTQTKE